MIKRKKTRLIRVGGVKVGGGAPVSIQSMVKVETSNVSAVVSQIKNLKNAGCDIVRVAVKTTEDAEAVRSIKRKTDMPIVCDIHFDHRLALKCVENGADKIRLNPGNIRKANVFFTAQMKDNYIRNQKVGKAVNIGDWLEYDVDVKCFFSRDADGNYIAKFVKIPAWGRVCEDVVPITRDGYVALLAERGLIK